MSLYQRRNSFEIWSYLHFSQKEKLDKKKAYNKNRKNPTRR
jgi:hypothetical protein